jgi:hypothetical protein
MKITILHLTDLHFSEKHPDLSDLSNGIAKAAAPHMRTATHSIVAFTGDIAYQGMASEYHKALVFAQSLRDKIQAAIKRPSTMVVMPGNHDVDTLTYAGTRNPLVERAAVPSSSVSAEDIQTCLLGQTNFRAFALALGAKSPGESKLITEFTLATHDGIPIVCTLLNSSWAAKTKQAPGTLVFPLEAERTALQKSPCYRIGFTHEPANWLRQGDYQQARAFYQENFSVLFSGHEHSATGEARTRGNDEACLLYEGGALIAEPTSSTGEFSIVTLDFFAMKSTQLQFTINLQTGVSSQKPVKVPFDVPSAKGAATLPQLAEKYLSDRADSCPPFQHPVVAEVRTGRLFVEPELSALSAENFQKTSSITKVLQRLTDSDILLLGDEGSGRTTLCYFVQDELVKSGFYAVYLRYSKLADFSQNSLDALFEKRCKEQFVDIAGAWQANIDARVLILDDVTTVDLATPSLKALLGRVKTHFGSIVAVADSTFYARGAFVASVDDQFRDFEPFAIRKFAKAKRHELITKWVELDVGLDVFLRDQKIHSHEARIDALIGKNLIPSTPWLVCVCLQNGERPELSDLQASGLGEYYQYLITSALGRARVQKVHLDEHLNFLTHLAGHMERCGTLLLSTDEFVVVCDNFTRDYHRVYANARLALLREAGILVKDGDIKFRFDYLYFYFFSRFVAQHMTAEERNVKIAGWAAALYKRYNVNALLFLAHHKSDIHTILNATVRAVESCLSATKRVSLDSDVLVINALGSPLRPIEIPQPQVSKEQQIHRRSLDVNDEAQESASNRATEIAETNQNLQELMSLFSSIDVLGQIAKNFYGSIHRDVKQQLILEVVNAAFRAIGYFVDIYKAEPSVLRDWVSEGIQGETERVPSEASIDEHIFDLYVFFVVGISTRTAQAISSEELAEDIAVVSRSQNTLAFRLLQSATQLVRPVAISVAKIEALAVEAVASPLVHQSLQHMVLEYVRLFHTRAEDRQRICNAVGVTISSIEAVNFQSRNRKQLGRPR